MGLCKTYSSNKIVALVADIPIDAGRASDEFLSITFESDTYGDSLGADGEVVRWVTQDARATITITLMQSSAGNDTLSTLYERAKAAEKVGNGLKYTFSARDLNGRSIHSADAVWIIKPPDAPYGVEAKTRVWTLRAAEMVTFIGGNSELAG